MMTHRSPGVRLLMLDGACVLPVSDGDVLSAPVRCSGLKRTIDLHRYTDAPDLDLPRGLGDSCTSPGLQSLCNCLTCVEHTAPCHTFEICSSCSARGSTHRAYMLCSSPFNEVVVGTCCWRN